MTDRTAEMTFPVARDRALVYLLVGAITVACGLLTWLCLSTLSLRDQVKDMNGQLLVVIERTSNYKDQIQTLQAADQQQQLATARLNLEVKELQLQAASHGWKRGQ